MAQRKEKKNEENKDEKRVRGSEASLEHRS
jgi:hypothetical protein